MPALVAGFGIGVGTELVAPTQALGQDLGSQCDLVSYRIITSRQSAMGSRVTWLGRPSLVCPDGLRIRADSAVVYEQTGRNELLGNVRFDTPERELRARNADYFERDGRLFAWGEVFLRDLERGTEVEGDTLLYLESGPQRPEDHVTVYGGRPRAVLAPAGERDLDVEAEPYRVVANRLRFEGERFFWGDGQVEVERGDLRASADSLAFDQESGDLILMRDARVDRGEVTASGGLLNLMIRDDRLESVRARRDGQIETQDFILTGDDVLVTLDGEEAVESVTSRGGEDGTLATLSSDEILLVGEVIQIDEGEDGLRVIRSTGRARGETAGRQGPPLDPGSGVPDRDWIEGDEVVARFVEMVAAVAPDADPEEGIPEPVEPPDQEELDPGVTHEGDEPRYRLQTLEATGNARTLYRSPPDRNGEDPEDPPPDEDALEDEDAEDAEEAPREAWAISYVLADRIVVHMVEGEVDRLETEGNVRGIQLEPERRGSAGRAVP
jgi:hypothetical protein